MLVDQIKTTEDSVVNIPETISLYSEQLQLNKSSIKWKSTKNISISSMLLTLETPAQGRPVRIAVKRNGVTFTNNIVEIAPSTDSVTILPENMQDTNATVNDVYSFEVKQLGTTVPGSGLRVQMTYGPILTDQTITIVEPAGYIVPSLNISSFTVGENTTSVGTLSASANGIATYTLAGGADADKFNLTSGGVLTFKSAPDFEIPSSSTSTNEYTFNVQITDDSGNTIVPVTVNLTNVVELWNLSKETQLVSSDIELGSSYGYYTAISSDGNTAIISAAEQDEPVGVDAGAVYAFIRSGGTWVFQQKIVPITPIASSKFGWDCALSADGNTAIISAVYANNTGRAYIFTRSGGVWTQQHTMTAPSPAAIGWFGSAVNISADGNTVIIGEMGITTQTGQAHIWTRSGTTWTHQAALAMSDPTTNSRFGSSAALSPDGNTAIVGAPYKANNNGAVYAFTRSGSVWTFRQKIVASDVNGTFHFALKDIGVSNNCDSVVIGAYAKNSNTGAAYYYTRSGNTWTQQQIIVASDAYAGAVFGVSTKLSLDGNTLAVGAQGANKAYIFTRSDNTFTEKSIINATVSPTSFGSILDMSGDGMSVVVGANAYNSNTGSAFIYESIENPILVEPPTIDTDYFTPITFTKETVPFNNGSAVFDFVGYSEHRYDWNSGANPVPAPLLIGTIERDEVPGLRIKTIIGLHNKTAGTYSLSVSLLGGNIPQSTLTKVYIKSLGELLTANGSYNGGAAGGNISLWTWTLTRSQYETFKNYTNDNIRLYRESFLVAAKQSDSVYYVPSAQYTEGSNYVKATMDFSITSGNTILAQSNMAKGLVLNNSLPSGVANKVILVTMYQPTSSAMQYLQLAISPQNLAQNFFGAITLPNLGTFATTAVYSKSNTTITADSTIWTWELVRQQPHLNPKTMTDFIEGEIEIDFDQPTLTKTITCGIYTGTDTSSKGYFQTIASVQSGLGSLTDKTVFGQTLVAASQYYAASHAWTYMFFIRFAGDLPSADFFKFVEVEGLGRFYSATTNVYKHPSGAFTQYAWKTNAYLHSIMPTSGTKAIKFG